MALLKTMDTYHQMCRESKDLHRITEDERKKLQSHLLKMYKDLEAVCDRHDLSVMLAYGSTLGAIRHKGFIPWDDDLDVFMLRDDYDKFINLFAEELPDNYIVYAPNSKNGPTYRFGKLIDKDTTLLSAGAEKIPGIFQGIYIDIFPLEYIGTNKFINKAKRVVSMFLMYTSSSVAQWEKRNPSYKKIMSGNRTAKFNYWFRNIYGLCFSFIKSTSWYNLTDKFCHYKKKTQYVDKVTGDYRWVPMPLDMFIPTTQGEIDGVPVHLPHKPIDFLEFEYGDWQRIPPENERWEHYVKELSFNIHKE
ncbi:MAG: LicD family protein [Muribaculaceae bacterium]|nr:LicD family protein [Muribaculaceae bacterium]MBR1727661.1 LicD family protein [Muribaculaceae bacterium]